MAFWNTLIGYFTGSAHRQAGIQSGIPAQYSGESAVAVTPDVALGLSAVWAATRLISETVASMPINVYRVNRATGESVLAPEHPLALLFSNKVNRWQTKQEFFETITYQKVMVGNCYSYIQRGTGGRIVGLVPLMSSQMQVILKDDGSLEYRYNDGKTERIYNESEIWHVKLFGNGIIGLSPMGFARNAIGIGQGAEHAVTKIYRNGGKASGILTIDKVLSKEQREAVKKNFSDLSEGNADRLLVLEAGFGYTQTSLSPSDIELLASRRYQVEDIARFYGVPSVLINDTSSGTSWGSGVQQIVQGWYKLGLRPYLERYEASIRCNLLTPQERNEIEIEFDFNSLLRPDQAERIKYYKEGVQGGIITPNEARLAEGWKPLEGGDSLLVQQQMVKLENIDDVDRGMANDKTDAK